MTLRALTLADLGAKIPALTNSIGGAMREACMVCLADQNHTSGVVLQVNGDFSEQFVILWDELVTDKLRTAWKEEKRATEYAACAISLLLIQQLISKTAVIPGIIGEGFDYWLGDLDDESNNFLKHSARLEVSGIRKAKKVADVKKRLSIKHKQTKPTDYTQLPAYLSVTEFSQPVSWMVQK